ncbi:unnamed protein product, partial [marine sediment metagenome]
DIEIKNYNELKSLREIWILYIYHRMNWIVRKQLFPDPDYSLFHHRKLNKFYKKTSKGIKNITEMSILFKDYFKRGDSK